MRLTSLPALSPQERLTLVVCAVLALAAIWLISGSVDRVADGTPKPSDVTPATASPPVVYEGETP